LPFDLPDRDHRFPEDGPFLETNRGRRENLDDLDSQAVRAGKAAGLLVRSGAAGNEGNEKAPTEPGPPTLGLHDDHLPGVVAL
jgi:hypothetical protein